jgi:two-component system CitB family sensor kinase
LVLQAGVLLVAIAVIALFGALHTADLVRAQYERRVLAIARSVAADPELRAALAGADADDPAVRAVAQPLAQAVRAANGALFVVIADTRGIRAAHPDPASVGEPLSTDPGQALQGQEYTAIERGTLGLSVRGKVPINAPEDTPRAGAVVGLVSVGMQESALSDDLTAGVLLTVAVATGALGVGLVGSVWLARRVRRQTFGLDSVQIATLLESREAMLHALREGVLVAGPDGRLRLVNDAAMRLLGLSGDVVGARAVDVLDDGSVRQLLLRTDSAGEETMVAVGDRVLMASRTTARVRGEAVGNVLTLRDRTELVTTARELDSQRSLTDALRAQAHEFRNRMHTVAGLVELGRHDDAVRYITDAATSSRALADRMRAELGDTPLAALLVAKHAVAGERRIRLDVSVRGEVAGVRGPLADDLVTVVGNLVDNAMDAAGSGGGVLVRLVAEADVVRVEVADDGPGIDPELPGDAFEPGVSSKASTDGRPRGLGLALVRAAALRHRGSVSIVESGPDGVTVAAVLAVAR